MKKAMFDVEARLVPEWLLVGWWPSHRLVGRFRKVGNEMDAIAALKKEVRRYIAANFEEEYEGEHELFEYVFMENIFRSAVMRARLHLDLNDKSYLQQLIDEGRTVTGETMENLVASKGDSDLPKDAKLEQLVEGFDSIHDWILLCLWDAPTMGR